MVPHLLRGRAGRGGAAVRALLLRGLLEGVPVQRRAAGAGVRVDDGGGVRVDDVPGAQVSVCCAGLALPDDF